MAHFGYALCVTKVGHSLGGCCPLLLMIPAISFNWLSGKCVNVSFSLKSSSTPLSILSGCVSESFSFLLGVYKKSSFGVQKRGSEEISRRKEEGERVTENL